MRVRTQILLAILSLCLVHARETRAGEQTSTPPTQDTSQPDFSPPPVPEFMLRKPEKPLTLEEMQRQADEAAQRARAQSGKGAPPPKSPAQSAGERAHSEKERP